MHVVVIGAGVVGVTTAYYLSRHGYQVTVLERASDVAAGSSYGNAGQLSYTFTDALANPDFVARIPGLLAGRDPASKIRLGPDLFRWGIRFLAQCTSKRAAANTVAVLKTALHSAKLMAELCETVPLEFSHRACGKLVLLSDAHELRAAEASARLKNKHGSDAEILSVSDALRVEPTLAKLNDRFIAAIYSRGDAVADSRKFAFALRDWLSNTGNVTFRLGCNVERIVQSQGHLAAVRLGGEELAADAAVVCSGAWSGRLLQPLGIRAGVYPVRGYSVSLPAIDTSPNVSVTILNRRIVLSRMDNNTRIAGFADFIGFDTSGDAKRVATLLDVARRCAPLAADYAASDQQHWGGFRPMTPDGRPLVGPSGINGLYLNTGHGMLGWTLACASAHDVARAVAGQPTH